MKKIALTGTIASGKTTVAILLKKRRYPVFDADGYAHLAFYKTSPTYSEIVQTFGQSILSETDEIDTNKLAEVIFSDETKRKELNKIVHPFVRKGMLKFFENHTKDPIVFAEVPLLFEAGWQSDFDEIVLVTCDRDVAIKRMMEDRDYTMNMAEKRYASQLDPAIQRKMADRVIDNDGSIVELNQKIGRLLKEERECLNEF